MKLSLTLLVGAALFVSTALAFPLIWSGSVMAEQPANALFGANPLVINEIDYDQASTDTAEFIELKNNGPNPVNLDNYTVELVNGSNGAVEDTFDLPNLNLAAGDYFVICANALTVPNCDLDVAPDTNLIQNGAPEAVALLLSGTIVDTVSHEGSTVAPYTEGTGVPTSSADSNTVDFIALSRFPDGADTNDNSADFSLRCITPGAANASADTGCTAPGGGVPDLTVSDVTAVETSAGTTTFTFTVTLSAAAPVGGVTFDIATADGTAQDGIPGTEDSDYVAQSLTGQTIPEGSTGPYNFNVTVNGDTVNEPNETFFVNVTNVVGANVADGQGVGTISNDDAPTAAGVPISGRVTTAAGRGIQGVRVTLSSAEGVVMTTLTTSFGYYSFEDVPAGEAYVLRIQAKRYQFNDPVRLINLSDAVSGVDFIAN